MGASDPFNGLSDNKLSDLRSSYSNVLLIDNSMVMENSAPPFEVSFDAYGRDCEVETLVASRRIQKRA